VIRGSYRAGLVPSASNRRNERLRIALVFTMALFAGGNGLVGRVLAAEPAPSARWCVAAAYRQFDFWVGDWDAFDVGSSIPVAHARIDRFSMVAFYGKTTREPTDTKARVSQFTMLPGESGIRVG
jgi:hypothetical protein